MPIDADIVQSLMKENENLALDRNRWKSQSTELMKRIRGYQDINAELLAGLAEFKVMQQALKEAMKENEELKEFAIWMTGCGYDFCQHEYFIKMRDRLLKLEGESK